MNLFPPDSFAICQHNVIALRAEPAHRAEQVSQLLLGERISLTGNEAGRWVEVVSLIDDYKGWCLSSQLSHISRTQCNQTAKKWVGAEGARIKFDDYVHHLFAGSDISFFSKKRNINGANLQGIKGHVLKNELLQFEPSQLIKNARQFLGTPYLWGGKTTAGIDCSGLSQILYRLMGQFIPRDASQQAEVGETVYFLHEARIGDLAFFDNEEGRINHVGILLSNHNILHATETSGCVVIDHIDAEGIVSNKLKHRTHRLRTIRRII